MPPGCSDWAKREVANKTAAIMDAGQKRARPIIMTTIAMAAGMAPSAMAIGAGGEFRSPMAIAVIGGLLVSTVLSLLFVPAVFTAMDDLGGFLMRVFGRFIAKSDEPGSGYAPMPPPPGAVHPSDDGAAGQAGKKRAVAPEPAK